MAKRERMNVKVDAEVVRKAKVVAAARRLALSDYVTGLLRPLVENDLARVAAGLLGSDDAGGQGPGPERPARE